MRPPSPARERADASRPALLRPTIRTLAPALAKIEAIPLPMPLLPPVTMTERPAIDVNMEHLTEESQKQNGSAERFTAGYEVTFGQGTRRGRVARTLDLTFPGVGVQTHPCD